MAEATWHPHAAGIVSACLPATCWRCSCCACSLQCRAMCVVLTRLCFLCMLSGVQCCGSAFLKCILFVVVQPPGMQRLSEPHTPGICAFCGRPLVLLAPRSLLCSIFDDLLGILNSQAPWPGSACARAAQLVGQHSLEQQNSGHCSTRGCIGGDLAPWQMVSCCK